MKKILVFILIAFLVGCSLIGNAVDFVGEEMGYQLDLPLLTPHNQDLVPSDGLRNMQSSNPIINDTSKKY